MNITASLIQSRTRDRSSSGRISLKTAFTRPPLLYNKKGDKKIVMAYDPARSTDNSILTVAEFREDPHKGWMADIVNCVSSLTWG